MCVCVRGGGGGFYCHFFVLFIFNSDYRLFHLVTLNSCTYYVYDNMNSVIYLYLMTEMGTSLESVTGTARKGLSLFCSSSGL